MTKEELLDQLSEHNPDALQADGFEDAIIGIVFRANEVPVLLYDRDKCIEVLEREGLDSFDAEEYFSFNVEGAYVGENTPAYAVLVSEPPKEGPGRNGEFHFSN